MKPTYICRPSGERRKTSSEEEMITMKVTSHIRLSVTMSSLDENYAAVTTRITTSTQRLHEWKYIYQI